MFSFEREQMVFDIAGIKIGGQPGQYPTVLAGSIFYEGDSIVKNQEKGEFDRETAERMIREIEFLYDQTGNPALIDVVLNSKNFQRYIDFIAEKTDLPFFIDAPTSEIRMEAAKYAGETGLERRAIYNSLSTSYSNDEVEVIKDAGIKSAVLLCFNPRLPTIEGRIAVLNKLLEVAKTAGIEKTLVDPGVLDLPDPGIAARCIHQIKKEYGLPSGCGTHNAVYRWKQRSAMDTFTYNLRAGVAAVLTVACGADFVLYGPISHAKYAYLACSLADAYIGYAAKFCERKKLVKNHPLYKIFRSQ